MADYKVVDAEKLNTDLASVADAIRTKGNTTDDLTFPNGFVDAVNAIESGGGEDTLRLLFTNQLTEYTINDAINLSGFRLSASSLKKFVAPNMTSINDYLFYACKGMKYMDLGRISSFPGVGVAGLHWVETIILRKTDTVVSLSSPITNTNSITREDYEAYCYFYVPKALIEEYKVATNWSNYANRFRAIEDYPEITGGVL